MKHLEKYQVRHCNWIQIEADEETLPYAEEDWEDPEQIEVPKNLEPDLLFLMQTRQSDGTRPAKKYHP